MIGEATTTLQLRENLSIQLRRAAADDLELIARIYDEAVRNTTATFDTEVRTPEEWSSWLDDYHGEHHPVWVVRIDEKPAGWCALSPAYKHAAYGAATAPMVFLDTTVQHKGLGPALMMFLEDEARSLKFHSMISRVCSEQKGVRRMLERVGYQEVGTEQQVGRKFGRWLDVVIHQKLLC